MKLDWGGAASGGLAGAGTGSMFGPWGTAIGGGVGALAGLFGVGKSKDPKIKQTNLLSPEQQQYQSQILAQLQDLGPEGFDYLRQILGDDPELMQQFEQPALDQFNQQIIPSILERFSGMGARSSSALNQTLGQAGKELSTNLSAQRAGLKQNALQQLNQLSGIGLNQSVSPYVKEGKSGWMEQLAPIGGDILKEFAKSKFTT